MHPRARTHVLKNACERQKKLQETLFKKMKAAFRRTTWGPLHYLEAFYSEPSSMLLLFTCCLFTSCNVASVKKEKNVSRGQSCLCKALFLLHTYVLEGIFQLTINWFLAHGLFSSFCQGLGFFSSDRFSEVPELLRVWKHFLWKAFLMLFSSVFLTVRIYFRRLLCALCV